MSHHLLKEIKAEDGKLWAKLTNQGTCVVLSHSHRDLKSEFSVPMSCQNVNWHHPCLNWDNAFFRLGEFTSEESLPLPYFLLLKQRKQLVFFGTVAHYRETHPYGSYAGLRQLATSFGLAISSEEQFSAMKQVLITQTGVLGDYFPGQSLAELLKLVQPVWVETVGDLKVSVEPPTEEQIQALLKSEVPSLALALLRTRIRLVGDLKGLALESQTAAGDIHFHESSDLFTLNGQAYPFWVKASLEMILLGYPIPIMPGVIKKRLVR